MDKSKIWLSVAQIMTTLNRDAMNLTQLHILLIPAYKGTIHSFILAFPQYLSSGPP